MADDGALDTMAPPSGMAPPSVSAPAPQPQITTPSIAPAPPPIPASATGAMTMQDLINAMPPEQRVIYEAQIKEQQQARAQSQAAAAAQAEAARRQAADTEAYLKAPRPPIHTPQYKAIPKAPEPQYRPPLEAFGNPLAGLALVAGLFTRTPAVATMNAATAAINAQRVGDQQAFDNNMAVFKAKLEETIRANDLEHQAYADSWNNRKATMEEKLSDIQMKATLYKNQAMATAARGGKVSDVQMQLGALVNSKRILDELRPSVSASKPEQQVWAEADVYARTVAKQQGKENDPKFIAETRAEYFRQFDPKPKAGTRGLSADDQIKVAEAKARLAVEGIEARERAKLEREIEVLEAKGRAAEARADKKAETDRQLVEYKAKLMQEGRLQLAQFKAEESAKAAQARADEAMKREQVKIDAKTKAAAEKDARLSGKVGDTLRDTVAATRDMVHMRDTFKDEYANYAFDTLANLYMWADSRGGGTSPMALWWGNKEFALTMPIRHSMFGAALTAGERESWKMTDITPGQSADQIRAWFDQRIQMAQSKLNDQINTLRARGVSDENIRLVVGDLMPAAPAAPAAAPAGAPTIYDEYGLTPKPAP